MYSLPRIKYNDKTQSHINLRKEANHFLSQLRQLHNDEREYDLCYENLISNTRVFSFKDIKLDGNTPSENCIKINPTAKLSVEFTLADDQNNQFEIATIIEGGTKKNSSVAVVIENPTKEEDPYDYFKDNEVFIHGKNLFISGSASLFGNGTIIINNGDNIPDLILSGGGSKLDSKNIYIDRTGKNVIFDDSAHLGNLVSTDVVNIKGNVILNRGTAQIAGQNVYIDGDVEFNNSAFIFAKKLFINGNVKFNNYTAKITADEIYINGTVTKFKPESKSS